MVASRYIAFSTGSPIIFQLYMRNFASRLFRALTSNSQKSHKPPHFLQGKQDLPSVDEFLVPHLEKFSRNIDMKGMFTSDPLTNRIGRDILRNAGNVDSNGLNFFESNIFSQPNHSTQEAGSARVLISDIRDFPEFNRKYISRKKDNVMLCVGGPAAEDQSVLSSIIPEIRENLRDILYLTRDYKESNVNHAARQSHARHGTALNADHSLTGHALLPTLLMRKLIGVDIEDVMEANYKKIDVKFTIDPKKLRIYFGNELNWLKQEYKKYRGEITEHDVNRLESVLAQEILVILEKKYQLEISGGMERALQDSSSIHVAFDEKNAREVREENKDLQKVGISAKELTPEELEFFFGDKKIHSAWKYEGDNHIKFNAHDINRKFAIKSGVNWLDGSEVTRIFVTQNEKGDAEFAGVETKKGEYIYANKMHFTGGYKSSLEFDKDSEVRFQSSIVRNLINSVQDLFGLENPISEDITTSTGVSINAVFHKSDRMKRIIERYGSSGEIAVTNSHWTMIAQDNDYIVMRITGGGNTGSEEYNPAYFLNVIANTRRIFGDDLIGVLSTYGCPRAINARNSTEFAKIAEGAIVSYGKGGTGNTKRHAEAAMGLIMLGFGEEVIEYFNQFNARDGKLLGKKIEEIYEHFKDMNFCHDNIEKVNKRMGYNQNISAQEIIVIALVVGALSYVLHKAIGKDKANKPNENGSIEPTEAFSIVSETKDFSLKR